MKCGRSLPCPVVIRAWASGCYWLALDTSLTEFGSPHLQHGEKVAVPSSLDCWGDQVKVCITADT